MNEEPDKPNERVDRLLRRWGAEEAVRQTRVDSLRPPVPRPRARTSTVWQWLPLAASLVLIAGATAVLLVVRDASPESGSSETAQLRRELGDARLELEKATNALKQESAARDALARDVAALRQDLVRTRSELLIKKATLEDQAAKFAAATLDIRALATRLAAGDAALKGVQEQSRAREKELADLQKALTEARQTRANEAEEFRSLIARQKAALAAAQSERKDAEAGLAALRAQQNLAWAAFRQFYLAAAAPGRTGVRARQAAARENRLLPRCGELRNALRSEAARRLADQLEVALTRLELLDAGQVEDVASFTSQLQRSDIARRVQAVIAAGQETPAVCRWLLEAQLLLTEMNGEDS